MSRQRRDEIFDSKFRFRRAVNPSINQVSDSTFVTDYPQLRTTVVETFADDGTHIDNVYEGYDHRVDGIVSALGTDEDYRGSLFDANSTRATPSPANTDSPLLRREGTSRLDFRTPDTIPPIEHSDLDSGSDAEQASIRTNAV